jgi:hypothetical protein
LSRASIVLPSGARLADAQAFQVRQPPPPAAVGRRGVVGRRAALGRRDRAVERGDDRRRRRVERARQLRRRLRVERGQRLEGAVEEGIGHGSLFS